jgi:hypothetical protein
MIRASVVIGLIIASVGSSAPAVAQGDDVCPWGGDRSQSLLCFECMQRVWTGRNWRLVNTCKDERAVVGPFRSRPQPTYR